MNKEKEIEILKNALLKINQKVNMPYDAKHLLREIREISSRALYEHFS